MSKNYYPKPRPTKSEKRLLLTVNLPDVIAARNAGTMGDFALGVFLRRCDDAGITRDELREAGLEDA